MVFEGPRFGDSGGFSSALGSGEEGGLLVRVVGSDLASVYIGRERSDAITPLLDGVSW